MIDEKTKTIGIIESAAVELKSLIDIAQTFTDGKSDNNDIKEIDFCLSKMEEHILLQILSNKKYLIAIKYIKHLCL